MNQKPNDMQIDIATQIFIDMAEVGTAILPLGWRLQVINKDGNILLTIPVDDFKKAKDIKLSEKEIPFYKWLYLLGKSILYDISHYFYIE